MDKGKALIFDIQRYSVHDGPGIRTVVFFKGCPLRCQWCQNPESLLPSPELGFSPEHCISCGNCEKACPEKAILSGKKRIDRTRCTLCGECVETCYAEALKMIGKEVADNDLIKEVLRDRPFHEDSGGGVTLSGGEPMIQSDFLEGFCAHCMEEGISVVIETCGTVPFDSFQRILPFVDLFLYDIKAVDSSIHKAWTGSNNQMAISNLERLGQSGVPVMPRIPIVPDYTALPSNLHQISTYLEGSFQEVHLLPYHRWGESKRKIIDSSQPALQLDPPSQEDMEKVKMIFEEKGIMVKIGG